MGVCVCVCVCVTTDPIYYRHGSNRRGGFCYLLPVYFRIHFTLPTAAIHMVILRDVTRLELVGRDWLQQLRFVNIYECKKHPRNIFFHFISAAPKY